MDLVGVAAIATILLACVRELIAARERRLRRLGRRRTRRSDRGYGGWGPNGRRR